MQSHKADAHSAPTESQSGYRITKQIQSHKADTNQIQSHKADTESQKADTADTELHAGTNSLLERANASPPQTTEISSDGDGDHR